MLCTRTILLKYTLDLAMLLCSNHCPLIVENSIVKLLFHYVLDMLIYFVILLLYSRIQEFAFKASQLSFKIQMSI